MAGSTNIAALGRADNYLELGGYLLLATRILSFCCVMYGVELTLQTLLKAAGELAQSITAMMAGQGR
ncbi:MAG: hypothetical protein R3A44_02465 [Caldilineaceae bacterium]